MNHGGALIRDSKDGDLEIDNNGAGRSLQGIAVGRKKWLLLGSGNGRETAAILTDLVATCKEMEITYPRDIFQHLRVQLHEPPL